MKQLSLFDAESTAVTVPETKEGLPREVASWKLFVDGASRNNPGPAGAGLCIYKNGVLVGEHGFYLGKKTNNQAEYLALLLGIFFLEPLVNAQDKIEIVADSELLVKQLKGLYKVKNEALRSLHLLARQEVIGLNAQLTHTLRHANKEADRMANKGIDLKILPPPEFLEKLSRYGITY